MIAFKEFFENCILFERDGQTFSLPIYDNFAFRQLLKKHLIQIKKPIQFFDRVGTMTLGELLEHLPEDTIECMLVFQPAFEVTPSNSAVTEIEEAVTQNKPKKK